MDLFSARAVSSINTLSKPETGLRPFQRVTAQILDVADGTALLSIEGQPIVAQLTSAEQVKILLGQQTAQFIITKLTNEKITLKMIQGTENESIAVASPSNGTELAARLLEQHQLPATASNLMMARSILKQHLPVTRALLDELMGALSEYGVWGSKEAEVAASLKAAGLPVTAQSIALVSHQPEKTSSSISQLIQLFNDLVEPDLSADVLKQLELNMWMLNGLVLDGEDETSRLAEQLKAALEVLGKSLENILLEHSQRSESTFSEINLASLVQLQHTLENAGKARAAESIGRFLEDIRSRQFRSANPEWAEIEIPIQNKNFDEGLSNARLRIARDAKSNFGSIDLKSTRLILEVDIQPGETVQIDLAVMGEQIRTTVTAPNPIWCEHAESEIPSLEKALENLGFTLRDAKVSTMETFRLSDVKPKSDQHVLMAVDIEA